MGQMVDSGWALMAHACNSSYSGGSRGLQFKASLDKSQDPISKIIHHEKGLVEWFKV
jgi:hypothetical protein